MRNLLRSALVVLVASNVNGFNTSPAAGKSKVMVGRTGNVLPAMTYTSSMMGKRGGHTKSSLMATTSPSPSDTELDTSAILKYGVAAVTQLSLISGFFYAVDYALAATGNSVLPTPVTWIMCYAFSLKSRAFNPLNNARPDRKKAIEGDKSDGFQDRYDFSITG